MGKRRADRLHAIRASSEEDPHIRLRDPIPDHVACIDVSTFAHCLAGHIVVQEFENKTIGLYRHLNRQSP